MGDKVAKGDPGCGELDEEVLGDRHGEAVDDNGSACVVGGVGGVAAFEAALDPEGDVILGEDGREGCEEGEAEGEEGDGWEPHVGVMEERSVLG